MIWTLIFEWYVVRCGSKNGHKKRDMCSKEIGLCSKCTNYSSRLNSQSGRPIWLVDEELFWGTIWICKSSLANCVFHIRGQVGAERKVAKQQTCTLHSPCQQRHAEFETLRCLETGRSGVFWKCATHQWVWTCFFEIALSLLYSWLKGKDWAEVSTEGFCIFLNRVDAGGVGGVGNSSSGGFENERRAGDQVVPEAHAGCGIWTETMKTKRFRRSKKDRIVLVVVVVHCEQLLEYGVNMIVFNDLPRLIYNNRWPHSLPPAACGSSWSRAWNDAMVREFRYCSMQIGCSWTNWTLKVVWGSDGCWAAEIKGG